MAFFFFLSTTLSYRTGARGVASSDRAGLGVITMTPEEQNCLAKEIKSLKRKDNFMGKLSKKAHTDKLIPIVSIQAAPILESDAAAPTPISSREDATTMLPEQRKVIEKKKKKKNWGITCLPIRRPSIFIQPRLLKSCRRFKWRLRGFRPRSTI
ncbi:hypothetical protein COCNU_scaffold003550G000010 [Cocos nucifera]|nr:hypothetical protein [Cocos nucifera]